MPLPNKTIGNIIPELDENLEIFPFNKDEYLIQHTKLNYQVNINEQTHQLIKLIDGKKTINDIKYAYQNSSGKVLPPKFIHSILYNNLAKYGIIKQDAFKVETRKRASYLKLSFIFLKKEYVNYFTRYLTFLFNKRLFYPFLFLMSFFITVMIVANYTVILENSANIFSLNLFIYLIAFEFGSMFHELGHAAACRKFGANHGGIGFGFYLFLPVLFADVSDVWKLKPKERIIVNLGGIYFEMIIATILLILYFFNHKIAFLVIPCLLMLNTLYNLNPLIKFDGYWVLSDATNTPNLHKRAIGKLKEFIRFVVKKENYTFKLKDYFLIIYSVISYSFIFVLLGTILIADPDSVIKLPINLLNYIINVEHFHINDVGKFILPLIFWYLLLKLFISFLKKKIGKKYESYIFNKSQNP